MLMKVTLLPPATEFSVAYCLAGRLLRLIHRHQHNFAFPQKMEMLNLAKKGPRYCLHNRSSCVGKLGIERKNIPQDD